MNLVSCQVVIRNNTGIGSRIPSIAILLLLDCRHCDGRLSPVIEQPLSPHDFLGHTTLRLSETTIASFAEPRECWNCGDISVIPASARNGLALKAEPLLMNGFSRDPLHLLEMIELEIIDKDMSVRQDEPFIQKMFERTGTNSLQLVFQETGGRHLEPVPA